MQFALSQIFNAGAASARQTNSRESSQDNSKSFSKEFEKASKPAKPKTAAPEPIQDTASVIILPEAWLALPTPVAEPAPVPDTPDPEPREEPQPQEKKAEAPEPDRPARQAQPAQAESNAAPQSSQSAAPLAEAVETLAATPQVPSSQPNTQSVTPAQPASAALESKAAPAPQAPLPTPSAVLEQAQAVAQEVRRNPNAPITLRLTDADGRPLTLQVAPRVGKVHMVVKTEDRTLSDRLRQGLDDIAQQLKEDGVDSKVAVFCRKSSQSDANSTPNPGQDEDRARQHGEILRQLRQKSAQSGNFLHTFHSF